MTALYRQFNSAGELLYVGIADNPFSRLKQHYDSSAWGKDIQTVTIEWFESRDAAMASERAAVLAEFPIHNKNLRTLPIAKSSMFAERGERKVVAVFRLRPDLVSALEAEAEKSNTTKTRIVELALAEWFLTKRA